MRSKIALNVINARWWMMASFYCARISILQANETPRNIIFYSFYYNNNMHIAHVPGDGDKTMGNVTG